MLTSGFVTINCVVKVCYWIRAKNPYSPWKPIIDYNISIILIPTIMVGQFFGVIALYSFPYAVKMGLLIVSLLVIAVFAIWGTVRLWAREKEILGSEGSLERGQADHMRSSLCYEKEELLSRLKGMGGEESPSKR